MGNKDKMKEDLGVNNSDDDSDKDESQFFNLASKALKKISKPSTPGLTPSIGGVRGSFLGRGSADLKKIAEMTKTASEARTGSGAKKSNNFVFAAISPENSKKEPNDNDKEPEGLLTKEKFNAKRGLNRCSYSREPTSK